jgi:hypothetical protein
MPGSVVHEGAEVLCVHGGQAQPVTAGSRVRLGGQPIATQSSPYVISGCPLPASAGGPCVSAEWVTAATRVRSEGVPVLLDDSVAICRPTGTAVRVAVSQGRVKAR